MFRGPIGAPAPGIGRVAVVHEDGHTDHALAPDHGIEKLIRVQVPVDRLEVADARHAVQRGLERVEVLVVDEFLGDDGDRLRDVAQFLPPLADRRRHRLVGRLAGGFGCGGTHRHRVVDQRDAAQQLLHLLVGDRVLAADLVDLGHVVLGRGPAVDQLAVVGEQQQAGGVLVEPAHRLHTLHRRLLRPLAQGARQQGVDARPG